MQKKYNVAVIGATGIVGSTILDILAERHFPINQLYLLASQRSKGTQCEFNNKFYSIQDIAEFDFAQSEICFFCASNDIAAEYAPKAAKAGNVVIDKSSYFRYDADVPLVVPEVNSDAMKSLKKNIIASPNCNTIPIVVALKPIYDAVGLVRMNVATYQSVSGSGKEGVTELAEQTAQLLNGHAVKVKHFSDQIAFNLIPHIDDFQENGYTKEEMKIVWETQKILNDKTIAINPTAVRVPVFYGHSAAVHIETRDKLTVIQAKELLAKAPGIKLIEEPSPVTNATGNDLVYVGRIRADISHEKGMNFWIVADNLRKGAALNAVQIAEAFVSNK